MASAVMVRITKNANQWYLSDDGNGYGFASLISHVATVRSVKTYQD